MGPLAIAQAEGYVEEFGEQYRQLIYNAIRFLNHAEPVWRLPRLVNRREYIQGLILGSMTNREMIYRAQLWHVFKWATRRRASTRGSLRQLCRSLPGCCICGYHKDALANAALTRNYKPTHNRYVPRVHTKRHEKGKRHKQKA